MASALAQWQALWVELWEKGVGLALRGGRATLSHVIADERVTLTLDQCARLRVIPPAKLSREEPTLLLDGEPLDEPLVHPVEDWKRADA